MFSMNTQDAVDYGTTEWKPGGGYVTKHGLVLGSHINMGDAHEKVYKCISVGSTGSLERSWWYTNASGASHIITKLNLAT